MDEFGGLFEDLTINDEVGRVARRKAIAVANKRVDDRFGDFIRSASSPEEAAERFDLIKSDLENSVKEACAEFDVNHEPVLASIKEKISAEFEEAEEDPNDPLGLGDDIDLAEFMENRVPPVQGSDPGLAGLAERMMFKGSPAAKSRAKQLMAEMERINPKYQELYENEYAPAHAAMTAGEGSDDYERLVQEHDRAKRRVMLLEDRLRDLDERHRRLGQVKAASDKAECEQCGKSLADWEIESNADNPEDDNLCAACHLGNSPAWKAVWGPSKRKGGFKEARRPKMCPYHNELVNASLQVGEPQYAAFSGLVGGDAHCGGAFEGRCSFKPAMVTQDYWDQKETERAERKQQRELERQQENSFEMEAPHPDEIYDADSSISDQANLSDLDNAPSAVGEGLSDSSESFSESAESAEPVLARAAGCGCDEGKMCDEGECEKCDAKRKNDDDTYDVSHPGPDDGPVGKTMSSWSVTAVSDGDSWQKNDKVTQPAGPSPKMDKSVWKSLENIDTDAGPYKTRQQDVLNGPDYSKSDSHGQATSDAVLEQTKAVTTQETLPTATNDSDAGFNTDKNIEGHHTDTFGNGGQAKPVTSEVLAAQRAEALDYSPNQKEAYGGSMFEKYPSQPSQPSNPYEPQNETHSFMEKAPDPSKSPIRRDDGNGGTFIDYSGMPPAEQQKALDANTPPGMRSYDPMPNGPSDPNQQQFGMQNMLNSFDNAAQNATGMNPSELGGMAGGMAGQLLNNLGVQNPTQSLQRFDTTGPYKPNLPMPSGPNGQPLDTTLPYDPSSSNAPLPPGVNPLLKGGSVAHKVTEQNGKFYVTEDGGEKAAGPFDTEAEAKERAKEINNLENLEREAAAKVAEWWNPTTWFGGDDKKTVNTPAPQGPMTTANPAPAPGVGGIMNNIDLTGEFGEDGEPVKPRIDLTDEFDENGQPKPPGLSPDAIKAGQDQLRRTKEWEAQHGLDWKDFTRNGIDIPPEKWQDAARQLNDPRYEL